MSQLPPKLTIKYMREQSQFTRAAIARYAKLSEETLRKMEEGQPVSRESAQKALNAFNRLFNTSYSLEQIDVALLD